MPGNDDKIKSALEIALEKVQRLGALSEEEKQRLKNEEIAAFGKALAERYLSGLTLRDIKVELAERAEEDQRTITHHLLQSLLDRIDILHTGADDKIIAAIQLLSGDTGIEQSLKDLIQEYQGSIENARQENQRKLEAAKRSELESKGISGSAVQPAFETSSEWIRIRQNLDSYYSERFEELRQKCTNITDTANSATRPGGEGNTI
jgi:hypothetical protein